MSGWTELLGRGLADLVFAPVCVACRGPIPTASHERVVCSACWSRAATLPAPRCARCWSPAAPGRADELRSCEVCREFGPGVRALRSAYRMTGSVREMVHALKYGGWEVVAGQMAERLAGIPLPPDVREEAGVVVPVPTTRARRRSRGYNQAEKLAAEFALRTGRELRADVLVRSAGASTQTTLHPAERRANVARAFAVVPERFVGLAGAHLLLLDDVWTTGATSLACATALLDAGARAVSVLTFARALPDLEPERT